ncbi:MAG: hypothetical protein KDD61_10845 [Bdellovibrionales bacterium]|nr:hypothetical protein [Bdellovibrionales bacterium]
MSRLHTVLFTSVLLVSIDTVAGNSDEPTMFKEIEGWVTSAVSGKSTSQQPMIYRSEVVEQKRQLANVLQPAAPINEVAVTTPISTVAQRKAPLTFFERVKKEALQAVEFAKEKVGKYLDQNGLGNNKAFEKHQNKMAKKTKLKELNESLPNYRLGGQKTVGNDILKIQQSLTHSRFSGPQPEKRIPLSEKDASDSSVVSVKINPNKIDDLSIGSEPIIPRIELPVEKLFVPSNGYELAKRLRSPQAFNDQKIEVLKTQMKETVKPEAVARKEIKVPQAVTDEKLQKVALHPNGEEFSYVDQGFYSFNKNELDLLAAQIIRNNGSCHITTGLFDKLQKVKELKSTVQLEVAKCSYQMGLYRLAVESAGLAIRHSDVAVEAHKLLLKDYPKSFESAIAKAISHRAPEKIFTVDETGRHYYQLAKHHFDKGQYKKSLEESEKIPSNSKDFNEGQFLKAVNLEVLERENEAIRVLVDLQETLQNRDSSNKDLKIITGINLSRIYYQKGDFKKAYMAQLGINKNHNLWIRAMIEQGWIQISAGDFSGAIGNMYSIQSPYFKSVYKPESYAIRAIGYLSICQYGDAYSSLSILEKEYRPWLDLMKKYRGTHASGIKYYETVAKYLRGKSSAVVDTLPPQVSRELASQKYFLNIQAGINERLEEMDQWKFINSMISKDIGKLRWYRNKAQERVQKLKLQIAKSKKDKSLLPNVPEWKGSINSELRLIGALNFKIDKYVQGQKQFAVMEKQEKSRIRKEVSGLKQASGKFLKNHMTEMIAVLNQVLDNNEFLRFEIFSGSGENIRYRVSGGAVKETKRIPAHIKPKKHLSWNFEGEYWEDEIGSYRSNLVNNCPKSVKYVNSMNE